MSVLSTNLLIRYLRKVGWSSRSDLVAIFRVDPSTIFRHLRQAEKDGVVIRDGRGPATRYAVRDSLHYTPIRRRDNMGTNNIMLDLETMGTGPTSAIVAIGAVQFDDKEITSTFYELVSLDSCLEHDLTVDAGTILWWMKQEDAARKEITSNNAVSLPEALDSFSAWAGRGIHLWGNGASFDNVLLSNAYKATGLEQPWAYWNDHCYRTMKNLYKGIKMERVGTAHNALDDARSQALHLIRILRVVKA